MNDSITQWLIRALYMLPVCLLSLSIHEFSHGFAAHKLGDDTAKNAGRLTLNPIKHIDPFGFIALFLFRIGWAKPVPIDPRNFKKPKRDVALTALAGPLSNFLFAAFMTLLFQLFRLLCLNLGEVTQTALQALYTVRDMFLMFIYTNIGLGFFNLIPVTPFDGSRILFAFLPDKWIMKIAPYERYSRIAVLLLLVTGILSGPLNFLIDAVSGAFFSLADIIIPLGI